MSNQVTVTATGVLFGWKLPGKDEVIWRYGCTNSVYATRYIIPGDSPESPPTIFEPYQYGFTVSQAPPASPAPQAPPIELTDKGNASIGLGTFGVLRPLSPVAGQKASSRLSAYINAEKLSGGLVIKSGTYLPKDVANLRNEALYFGRVYKGICDITFNEEKKVYHAVLPRVPGTQLYRYLKDTPALTDTEKLKIIIATARALKCLHEKHRFIHGDAKINNFNVGSDKDNPGEYIVYPLDFGCSYDIGAKAIVCTEKYAIWHPHRTGVIPDQGESKAPLADPYHDVYSLAKSLKVNVQYQFPFLQNAVDRYHSVDDFIQAAEAQLVDLNKASKATKNTTWDVLAQGAIPFPLPVPHEAACVSMANNPKKAPVLASTELLEQSATDYSIGWAALPALLGVGATVALILTGAVVSGVAWIPLAAGLLIAGIVLCKSGSLSVPGGLGLFGVASERSDSLPCSGLGVMAYNADLIR